MADLTTNFAGIESPNPFWLASGPPTNTYGQVARAFDQGWGGAVWKTIGEPIINVFSRYGSVDLGPTRMMGFNNIELISDRPIADNLREIAEVKRNYPEHAVIASLMVESKREAWHEMVKHTEDTGADGIELNFGCPHGMSERGMGSAVGQVPDYTCQIVEWVKEVATIPVIVKLTPNVTDITYIARAAVEGGADALSLINTINSIVGVDLTTFEPHMHASGKRMCVEASYPDGRREMLNCAGYNHNWVKVYSYDDDVAPLLPAGTVLNIIGWFNNTASNPRVVDPRNWKGWGNRSIDDMFIFLPKVTFLTEEQYVEEVAARHAAPPRAESTRRAPRALPARLPHRVGREHVVEAQELEQALRERPVARVGLDAPARLQEQAEDLRVRRCQA